MLSKRERMMAIVAAGAVVLLGLYYLVLRPLDRSRRELADQELLLLDKLEAARKVTTASRQAAKRWPGFHADGLRADASVAESSLLNAMRAWSQEASLPLLSIRPDRATDSHGLHELSFQATADGSMRGVAGFLYRIEAAKLPARIRELTIASRTEGADDLTLQVRISTLWEDANAPTRTASVEKGQP